MPAQVVTTTNLPLPKFSVGKVRESYDLGDRLLMVATDRISAFDSIMPNGIPDKGRVLTQLSAFWFDRLHDVIANHLISVDVADLPDAVRNDAALREQLDGRFMIVKKAKRFDFECVVRGYLAGSGWADYQRTGAVCGVALPAGLRQGERLPEPIFTPATKAEEGHDLNVSLDEMKRAIGEEMAQTIADASITLYKAAATYALDRGIIIADTKMEYGLLDGELILIDELLTPDSSRYWPVAEYQSGGSPPSFDKQYLRDWLESSGWNKQPPAPTLPDDVVNGLVSRYHEAYEWLTGHPLPAE
ncbi:MAG TPA: phosphoribosylaminoimidazolesuccinocarboxamide synthase [Ktedonobacterales bacterium]|nr:phosphoribosylaminoimidazolesuccinocarboxamide synthase [Ktedonobacterales bacterium]